MTNPLSGRDWDALICSVATFLGFYTSVYF